MLKSSKLAFLSLSGIFISIVLQSVAPYNHLSDKLPSLPGPLKTFMKDMIKVGTEPARSFEVNYLPEAIKNINYDKEEDKHLLAYHNTAVESVKPFLMASKEVTNKEWREFYEAKLEDKGKYYAKKFLPDTSVWTKEFGYGDQGAMEETYFRDPRFDNYPVVGVSWKQAKEYCKWKTEQLRELLSRYPKLGKFPSFRLPSEAEWEYAALSGQTNGRERYAYPWGSSFTVADASPCNFGQVVDQNNQILKDFADGDNFHHTAPVDAMTPNELGLYHMAGNVAEWTNDKAFPNTGKYIEVDKDDTPDSLMMKFTNRNIPKKLRLDTTAGSPDRAVLDQKIENCLRDQAICFAAASRVVKGGSFKQGSLYQAVGVRQAYAEKKASVNVGFRVVMSISPNMVDYFK